MLGPGLLWPRIRAAETGGAPGAPGTVTLFLCGDVMTGRGIDQALPNPGDPQLHEGYVTSAQGYVALAEEASGPIPRPVDFDHVWGDALPELSARQPDLRIVNLETAVTTSDDAEPKGINYRMHPGNVPVLGALGADCCVLANNHVLDWGTAGLRETLAVLADAGIRTAGAGEDEAGAAAPAVLPAGETRVLVFAYGAPSSGVPRHWAATADRPGVNFLPDLSSATLRRVAGEIVSARRPGDLVVASIHWGPNWGYEVPHGQVDFARGLVDEAGVDVVHGHSSHHPKGLEVHRGRPILYGCGDFLNDYEGISGYEAYRDDLVLMYLPELRSAGGGLAAMTMVPFRIRNFRLNRASHEDAAWLAETLDRESRPFGTSVALGLDDTLTVDWVEGGG